MSLVTPIWRLQSKHKMLCKNHSTWFREVVRNAFDQVMIWKEKLHYLEEQDLLHNRKICWEELHKGKAQYIRSITTKKNSEH